MTGPTEKQIEAAARALCRIGTNFPTPEQTASWVDEKWHRFKYEAETALAAALAVEAGAVGVKPSIDTMREAALELLKKNGWNATARLSLHQVSGLMAQFGMNVSAGEIGCGYPECGCCADAACEDAIKQHPDFAALTPASSAVEGEAVATEPYGYAFQHEETGLEQVVDVQQVEWGFEKNNPRWQKLGPVYMHPAAPTPAGDAHRLADELTAAASLLETLAEDLPADDVSGIMMRTMAERNRAALDASPAPHQEGRADG